MGVNPRVVSVLKDDYSLPFSQTPLLTRVPLVHSGYANPTKSHSLKESLLDLIGKRVVEKVVIKSSLAFLQPAFSCPQTEQKVEANLRSEPVKSLFEGQLIQDGNPGDDPVILTNRGMGNLAGLQRRVLPHSNQPEVEKVFKVLPEQTNFPIHSSSLWFGHSSPRVYKGGQRSETDGAGQGYPDPLVPRRLVAESPVPGNLPTRYPDPIGPVPKVRLGSQHEEIRVGSPANFQFRRLPV